MNLGQRLKEARLKAGLKQEELAAQLGVSRQTISNWENDRYSPDIDSALKLKTLYNTSLDTLLSGEDVIQHFEDLATQRRRFWPRMLELGVIGELLGRLVTGLGFSGAGIFIFFAGNLLLNVAIVMHLRVFDHNRGQIFRGLAGLAGHWTFVLLAWLVPESPELLISTLNLICILLIWSAGIWTVDWKSTRLWLIIALYIGTPILLMTTYLTDQGVSIPESPFPGQYRIESILYPAGETADDTMLVDLTSANYLYLAEDGIHKERIGQFTYYTAPAQGEESDRFWRLIPEDNPEVQYLITMDDQGRPVLSYSLSGQLQWEWLLKKDAYYASVSVSTLGRSTFWSAEWYPEGTPGPEFQYSRNRFDIAGSGTMTLRVVGIPPDNLTLYEEYHHDDQVETQVYTLEPNRNDAYELKIKVRYDSGIQYILYRIPYGKGEFRFIVTLE